jgi:hypothetical protein
VQTFNGRVVLLIAYLQVKRCGITKQVYGGPN